MIAMEGIYTGTEIRLSEPVHVRPNVRVIVTFLEDKPKIAEPDRATQQLLALSGTWQDDRPVENIIRDIYENRKAKRNELTKEQKQFKTIY